ncbi:MAG: anaerobic ribonucleoside-triphosphate reductase activating protein [Candidatus Gastranaerophilales bacterium]|nr:anaerobic ribonucleoside-triphosphate reductase activating protein [Candidatus Gastranaerophilales bacterium]
MLIGGLQKSSLIDYKGKIAAVVFLSGCNFSCPFCHNPELVIPPFSSYMEEYELFDFLKTRKQKLDGVVISGGEPTIHSSLPEFAKKIKDLGFCLKLDTNGTNPFMLEKMLDEKLLDYIAMDIKTAFDEYKTAVRLDIDIEKIKQSMRLLAAKAPDYEFRTTVVRGLHTFNSFGKINEEFKKVGKIKRYYLQKFQKSKHVDESYINAQTFGESELKELTALFYDSCDFVQVR